jgi:F5/8 type C domain-containing protein
MKRCPKCKRKYEDDTLKFCLEDGATLSVAARDADPPATEIMPRVQPTLKSSAGSTIPSYPNAGDFRPAPSEARASNPILTAGVVAIVLLLVALVGIAAYFVFKQTGDNSAKTNPSSSPTANQGTSPTVREGSSPTVSSPGNTEIASSNPQTGTPLKITGSASSVRLAVQSNIYYPANAIDGKRSTAWIEGVDGPGLGEWIRFDFDREINLHRILIQPGYFKSPAIWAENNRIQTLTAYFSDGTSRDLTFTDRMDSQKVDIGSVKTKWVKFVIKSVYYGTDPDTAISEVAFEWD